MGLLAAACGIALGLVTVPVSGSWINDGSPESPVLDRLARRPLLSACCSSGTYLLPLQHARRRANEAAVVFLMAMAVRWVLLAGLIVAVARSLARRLQLPAGPGPQAGLSAGAVRLPLLLGLLNAVLEALDAGRAGETHSPAEGSGSWPP